MAWDTENTSHRENVSEDRDERATVPRGRQWRTLQNRADFLRVRAAGLRGVMPGFVLQAAPTSVQAPKRVPQQLHIGFTASKKVGNAVARNRAKRRLRALADTIMNDCADPNFDYVLIGRGETLNREFSSMESDLRRALKRVCAKREPRKNSAPRTNTP